MRTATTSASYVRRGVAVPQTTTTTTTTVTTTTTTTTMTTTTTTTTTSLFACADVDGYDLKHVANLACDAPGSADVVPGTVDDPLAQISTSAVDTLDDCASSCDTNNDCLAFVVKFDAGTRTCITLRSLGVEQSVQYKAVTFEKIA